MDAVFFLGDDEVAFSVVSARTRPHVACLNKNYRKKTADVRAGYAREVVLMICVVLLIVLFAVTALVTRLYHKKIHTLGDDWFAQGRIDVSVGQCRARSGGLSERARLFAR